jgi:hypothetical protein
MTRDHRNCLMHYLAPNLGAILILLLLLTGQIGAQEPASSTATTAGTMAPLTSSYQGTLTDAEGTPINGSVDMTARLYHEPVGGEAVWEEVRSGAAAVPVTNGLFHIQLGSVNPITMTLLSQPLWLGLSVDGDAEMSPREVFAPTYVPDVFYPADKQNSLIQSGNASFDGTDEDGYITVKYECFPNRASVFIAQNGHWDANHSVVAAHDGPGRCSTQVQMSPPTSNPFRLNWIVIGQ